MVTAGKTLPVAMVLNVSGDFNHCGTFTTRFAIPSKLKTDNSNARTIKHNDFPILRTPVAWHGVN